MYDAHFHQDKMYDMNIPVLCAEKKTLRMCRSTGVGASAFAYFTQLIKPTNGVL